MARCFHQDTRCKYLLWFQEYQSYNLTIFNMYLKLSIRCFFKIAVPCSHLLSYYPVHTHIAILRRQQPIQSPRQFEAFTETEPAVTATMNTLLPN